MIRLYTGEYLLSPYALHFGLNRCSHGCVYCFANLNKPDRETEAEDIARIAKWYDQGSTCAEFELLQAGHPVLTSNDSDPCAKSCAPTFMALHDASRRFGFRLVYQTRGGEPESEARILSDAPTTVYVSLTTDQEATRKRFEPGCTSFEHRMDFIRRCRERGHHVIVGLNPFIPAWWDNLAGAFKQLAGWGVAHVWHQPVHLSRFQVAAMTESGKGKFVEFIDYAQKKVAPDAKEYGMGLDTLHELGFNTLRGGISERLGFWDAHFANGHPFFPTLDAFVRDVQAAAGGAAMITLDAFDQWARVFKKDRSCYKEFLVKFGRSIRNLGEKTESAKSMRAVHAYLWRAEEFPTPFRSNAFARVDYEGGWASDEHGIPLFAVSSDPFAATEVPVTGLKYLEVAPERR